MELTSIREFIEQRKETLLKELRLISSNWNEMELNDNENFYYPFIESFDELISELDEDSDYEDIKVIHSKIIKRLEEAYERERE